MIKDDQMLQKNLSSNKIDTVTDKADEKASKNKWSDSLNSLELFSKDFMSNGRNEGRIQIKRLFSVMANKQLRKIYFDF